jgi:hypothetical protein
MIKKLLIITAFSLPCLISFSQQRVIDTSAVTIKANDSLSKNDGDDFDYESLLNEMELFLDSISAPHSYFLAGLSIGNGNFNFLNNESFSLDIKRKITYAPALGYYDKSGLGITALSSAVHDNNKLNLYQFSISPSYDYLRNRNLATGFSYTRFFTKNSLPFYTTPIQNELYGYFTWRKWWVRPMVAVSYGWGSRSEFEEREELITSLRLRPRGYTRVNSKESISDFSVMTSVKHDFYWLDIFGKNDYIRFTPQLTITSGSQKFGFNQTSNTYGVTKTKGNSILFNSENIYLDDKLNFQPLSAALYLRGEYSFKKFYIQPQLIFDYYFPAAEKNFNAIFSVNIGAFF